MKKFVCLMALSCLLLPMATFAGVQEQKEFDYIVKINDKSAWTWENMAKIPNVTWETKKPKKRQYGDEFTFNGEFKNKNTAVQFISVTGTKARPIKIEFYNATEGQKYPTKLKIADFTDKDYLTKSVCDIEMSSLVVKSYDWQKAGSQPLYLKYTYGVSNGIPITTYSVEISPVQYLQEKCSQ